MNYLGYNFIPKHSWPAGSGVDIGPALRLYRMKTELVLGIRRMLDCFPRVKE